MQNVCLSDFLSGSCARNQCFSSSEDREHYLSQLVGIWVSEIPSVQLLWMTTAKPINTHGHLVHVTEPMCERSHYPKFELLARLQVWVNIHRAHFKCYGILG